jgi:UDP-N-acetylmuramate--alanine ligase
MKIHFIGIGGIGVSALARYYLAQGHEVLGSDLASSEITKDLEKLGAKIFIGKHKAKNLPKDTNLVIYSPAVQENNPELLKAKRYKLKAISYPQALGELTKKYFTIAVCGTHGKSTTTALIGLILEKAGLDPTVILGTKLKEFKNSNCRVGNSQYLVIEADEHFASFLNYWPKIIVLTSLDPDHLDYYQNFKNYLLAFKNFISHLPKEGILILNDDDKNIKLLKSKLKRKNFKIINYSLKQKEVPHIKKVIRIPGEFNVLNSLAALNLARVLNIPDNVSFSVFEKYKGAWRRFEKKRVKINKKNVILISDYGHHPVEVEKTLNAAREKFKNKKIICIFQPHQYQRTYYLFKDFVRALKKVNVDELIITDIYEVSGREDKKIKKLVSAKMLAEKIKKENVFYLKKEKLFHYIENKIGGGEVLIIMGAGDIYELWKKLSS